MKEIIEDYYHLPVLGFIKVNENVFKVKTHDQSFFLKMTDDCHLREIVEYIDSIHLQCFIQILRNKNNDILTPYKQRYFYLMEAVEESLGHFREVKIKFYFEILAYIHNNSCYSIKVNKEYFKKIYHDLTKIMNERMNYYNQLMNECENIVYRSPSQWLFLLNYYRISESLYQAQNYLKRYMDIIGDCQNIRVCLVYKHFDYDHISLKSKKLISIDQMSIDMPIYDIFDIYQRLPDILFDLDCLSDYYLKSMNFNEQERLLLCCLLNIAPIIYLEKDEVSNIIKISRLLYYLDSISCLCKQLDIQKPREFH